MSASCKGACKREHDALCEIKTVLWFRTSCQCIPKHLLELVPCSVSCDPLFLYAFPSLSFFPAPSVGVHDVMCDVNEREKQQGLLGPPGAGLRSLHYKNRTPFISHYASDLTRLPHQRAATDTRGEHRAFSLPLLRAALLHAQRRI